MNKEKKIDLISNIISIGFIIAIVILSIFSGIVFPNLFISAEMIASNKVNFLNCIAIILLIIGYAIFMIYYIKFSKKANNLEEKKEDEIETKY